MAAPAPNLTQKLLAWRGRRQDALNGLLPTFHISVAALSGLHPSPQCQAIFRRERLLLNNKETVML
jgi:hypothetical protein